MQISIGPLYYFWTAQQTMDFYAALAEQPADRFFLGEVVCSKRRALKLADWLQLGRDLQALGKEVVLSTLTLIEAESEVSVVKRIVENGEFTVECNDISAVQFACERGLAFTIGPAINVYNSDTFNLLAQQGMQRWVPPVELSAMQVEDIYRGADEFPQATIPNEKMSSATMPNAAMPNAAMPQETMPGAATPHRQSLNKPALEIFAQGRLPLAWAARCYTARYHQVPKDQCGFVCQQHPEGLAVRSLEEQALFQINGIQTLSHQACDLSGDVKRMQKMGVDAVRLSLDHPDQVTRVSDWRALLDDAPTAQIRMMADDAVNGYWHGLPGMVRASR